MQVCGEASKNALITETWITRVVFHLMLRSTGIRKEVICLGVIYSPLTIDWEAILARTENQFRIGSDNTLSEQYKVKVFWNRSQWPAFQRKHWLPNCLILWNMAVLTSSDIQRRWSMNVQSLHNVLIILHAAAAAISFFAGCFLILSLRQVSNQRLFSLYWWSLIGMVVLLISAMLVYWNEYSGIERIVFPVLLTVGWLA